MKAVSPGVLEALCQPVVSLPLPALLVFGCRGATANGGGPASLIVMLDAVHPCKCDIHIAGISPSIRFSHRLCIGNFRNLLPTSAIHSVGP